jgi:predicted  nucleic acid-binding Zn-ribbon protein
VSEWRKYRKDIKKRAKTAMETSRQLLVARARIAELEAAAGSTELEIRRLKDELRDAQVQSGRLLSEKDYEIEQLKQDREAWKQRADDVVDAVEQANNRAADATLRLKLLEDAVRSAAKLLPMSIQQGRSG